MSLYPLPPLILFEEHNGDWKLYQEALYKIFKATILNRFSFLNFPVKCAYLPPVEGMHQCFWHLITKNPTQSKNEEERLPDFRRSEKIKWIPHILNNYMDSQVCCWESRRGSNIHTILWLKQERYMIILSKRKKYYLLKTAYVHSVGKTITNENDMKRSRDPRKT